jgi:large subunit ribosomal protein L29
MKIEEIRSLKLVELKDKLQTLKDELVKLRYQLSIGQLENTGRIKLHKKDIARIKTVIREKELAGKTE